MRRNHRSLFIYAWRSLTCHDDDKEHNEGNKSSICNKEIRTTLVARYPHSLILRPTSCAARGRTRLRNKKFGAFRSRRALWKAVPSLPGNSIRTGSSRPQGWVNSFRLWVLIPSLPLSLGGVGRGGGPLREEREMVKPWTWILTNQTRS